MNLKQLLQTPEIQVLLPAENPNFEAAAALINAVLMVPNPEPQQQVPVPPTLEAVLGLVTSQERFAIGETEAYKRILDAVAQNRFNDWVVENLITLLGGGIISQDSFDSIVAVLNTPNMIPDPNYQPLVPGRSLAQENGLIGIDAGQVMLAHLS